MDCENWDIFSVWAGRHTMTREELAKADAASPKRQRERHERLEKQRDDSLSQIRQILATHENRPLQALKVMAKIDLSTLDASQQEFLAKLRAKAEQLHEEDPYEIANEDW